MLEKVIFSSFFLFNFISVSPFRSKLVISSKELFILLIKYNSAYFHRKIDLKRKKKSLHDILLNHLSGSFSARKMINLRERIC